MRDDIGLTNKQQGVANVIANFFYHRKAIDEAIGLEAIGADTVRVSQVGGAMGHVFVSRFIVDSGMPLVFIIKACEGSCEAMDKMMSKIIPKINIASETEFENEPDIPAELWMLAYLNSGGWVPPIGDFPDGKTFIVFQSEEDAIEAAKDQENEYGTPCRPVRVK